MKMNCLVIASLVVLFLTGSSAYSQVGNNKTPLDTAGIKAQMDYVFDKANTYNEYKVIKTASLYKLKKNINDSILAAKKEISQDKVLIAEKNNTIDTLQNQLQVTQANLDEAVETKNSLSFLGIQMDKTYYNSLMWTILAVLAIMLGIVTMMFKRSNAVTSKTRAELDEVKNEYDEYRNNTRINKEQLVVKHHDEVKKLKEQLLKQKTGSKF